jgi:hypothetical protein
MSKYEPQHLDRMTPFWLLECLLRGDIEFGAGRWDYWTRTLTERRIPDDPIPQAGFFSPHDPRVREVVKHINEMLKFAVQRGHGRNAWMSFVLWLLHGIGDYAFREYDSPLNIPDMRVGAETLDFWYENFQLGRLQQTPTDYCAIFAQGDGDGSGHNPYTGVGYFATPAEVCRLMVEMTLSGDPHEMKSKSVYDPCMGSGSILLEASNYSLNLWGQEIMYDLYLMARLNGWLYMPWLVCWPEVGPTHEELFGGSVEAHVDEALATSEGQYILPAFAEIVMEERRDQVA